MRARQKTRGKDDVTVKFRPGIAFVVEGKGLQLTAGEANTTQVLRRLVAEAAC